MRGARWALVGVAAAAAVVAAIWIVGLLLPVEHTASVSRVVDGAPTEVWAVVTGVEDFPEWRSGLDGVERLAGPGGRLAWREYGAEGSMAFQATDVDAPRLMRARIADADLPFGGSWTYELDAVSRDRTRVTLTEEGEVYDPFFRFMGRFVFGHTTTMERYLDDLEARLVGGGTR